MNEFKKTSTGELIPFESASLSADTSSWLWTFNATVPDAATLAKLTPLASLRNDYIEVSFKLGLQVWHLIIEETDSGDTDNNYSVSGRSRSILLAEPYSLPITKSWSKVMASAIAYELCTAVGVTLTWGIQDWLVDSLIADKRYPIDIITDLAKDIGATVQTLPSGTLAIVYSPVCSPNHLPTQLPDFNIATNTNLFTRRHKRVNNKNYNSVLVTTESSGNSAGAPTVSFEETVDGYDRLLSVFINPFVPRDEINLHHASGANVNAIYEGTFNQTNTDQLIVQEGKAQLSKPFDDLLTVTWHQDVIGELAIDKRGAITTDIGFGLVTVTYRTRFHRWRFNNVGDVDLTAVAVDEIAVPVNVSALSLYLSTGAGDNEAPPVIVKTLSTLAALKARGEAELWQQLYDADEYSIECAYQNYPILPAKIAQVTVQSAALTFNSWVKSVSINIGNDITQSIVIERPLL